MSADLDDENPPEFQDISPENYSSPEQYNSGRFHSEGNSDDQSDNPDFQQPMGDQDNIIQSVGQPITEDQIGQSIIQTINAPIIQNIEQPQEQNNYMSNNQGVANSYSYYVNNKLNLSGQNEMNANTKVIKSIMPNYDNPLIYSGLDSNNNNNNYAQVQVLNNLDINEMNPTFAKSEVQNFSNPLIASGMVPNENYINYSATSLNNNRISPLNEIDYNGISIDQTFNKNQYQNNTPTKVINPHPEYNNNNNVYYSTPIQGNYINPSVNVSNVIHSYQPNNVNFSQPRAQVTPIKEEDMKDPVIAKNVNETQKHINNYLSKIERMNNMNNNSTNHNSKYINREKNDESKLRGKNKEIGNNINENEDNVLNINELKDTELWKHFYDEDDSFFEPVNPNEVIHEQLLESPNKKESYFGDVNSEKKKHGFGKLITPDKQQIGQWKNDKFHGWGREIRKTGEIYEGKFIKGTLTGKGIYKFGDILYIGQFLNYMKHGKGELFNKTFHYVGDFKTNKIDGKGRIEIYNEGVYEGDFDGGEITGSGIYKFNDGDFYEGDMKKGKMHGFGKLTMNNGQILEGRFVNGTYKVD